MRNSEEEDGMGFSGLVPSREDRELETEKQRRVYYQTIVYDACRVLDKLFPGITIAGTMEEPSDDVQHRLRLLRKMLTYIPAKAVIKAYEKVGMGGFIITSASGESDDAR